MVQHLPAQGAQYVLDSAVCMAMGVLRCGNTVALILSMLGNSHDGINVSEVPQYHSVFYDVRILECQQ